MATQTQGRNPQAADRQINPPPETCFVAVDGGRIAYDDSGGNGPLILAIPGMGDLRSEYRLMAPRASTSRLSCRYDGCTRFRRDLGAMGRLLGARGRPRCARLDRTPQGGPGGHPRQFVRGRVRRCGRRTTRRRVSAAWCCWAPSCETSNVPWYASLALKTGFAGPWRVWFWMTYWNSLFPTRKPADHEQAKAALKQNLREPGRMAALRTMLACPRRTPQPSCPRARSPLSS